MRGLDQDLILGTLALRAGLCSPPRNGTQQPRALSYQMSILALASRDWRLLHQVT